LIVPPEQEVRYFDGITGTGNTIYFLRVDPKILSQRQNYLPLEVGSQLCKIKHRILLTG